MRYVLSVCLLSAYDLKKGFSWYHGMTSVTKNLALPSAVGPGTQMCFFPPEMTLSWTATFLLLDSLGTFWFLRKYWKTVVSGWERQVSEPPARHSFEGWPCHGTASEPTGFTPSPVPTSTSSGPQEIWCPRRVPLPIQSQFLAFPGFLFAFTEAWNLPRPIFPFIADEIFSKNNVGNGS